MGFDDLQYLDTKIDDSGEVDQGFSATDRGFVTDPLSHFYRGVIGTLEAAEGMGTAVTGDVELGLTGQVAKYLRSTEFAKPDLPEYLENEGVLSKWTGMALESLPTSAASLAVGMTPLGLPGALVTMGAVSGLGTYGDAYARYVPEFGEEQAHNLALKEGVGELLTEAPSQLLTLGAGGALFKTAAKSLQKQGLDASIKNMMKAVNNKAALKQLGATGAGILGTEVGTEGANAYYQATALNKAYGRDVVDPEAQAIDAMGTAMIMSFMFTGAGATMSAANRQKIKNGLQSDSKDVQRAASLLVESNLKDPEIKAAWRARSEEILADPSAKFNLNEDSIKLGESIIEARKKVITTEELTDPTQTQALKEKVDQKLEEPGPLKPQEEVFPRPKGERTTRPEPVPELPGAEAKRTAATQRQRVEARKEAIQAFNKYEPTQPEGIAKDVRDARIDALTEEILKRDRLIGVKERTKGLPITAEEYGTIFTKPETEAQRVAERRADAREAFQQPTEEVVRQAPEVLKAGQEFKRYGPVKAQRFDPEKGNILHVIDSTDPDFDPTKLERGFAEQVSEGVFEKDMNLLRTEDTDGEFHTDNIAKALLKQDITPEQRTELNNIIEATNAGTVNEEALEKRVVEIATELGYDGQVYKAAEGGTGIGVFSDKIAPKEFATKEDIQEVMAEGGAATQEFQEDTKTIGTGLETTVKTKGERSKALKGSNINWTTDPDTPGLFVADFPGFDGKMGIKTIKKDQHQAFVVRGNKAEDAGLHPSLTEAKRALDEQYGNLGAWSRGKEWNGYTITGRNLYFNDNLIQEGGTDKTLRATAMEREGITSRPFKEVKKGKATKTGVKKEDKVKPEPVKVFTKEEIAKEEAKRKGIKIRTGASPTEIVNAYVEVGKGIYKVGMKLAEFAKKLRTEVGTKAYNSIRNKIKEIYAKVQAHLDKVTTGSEKGQVVIKHDKKKETSTKAIKKKPTKAKPVKKTKPVVKETKKKTEEGPSSKRTEEEQRANMDKTVKVQMEDANATSPRKQLVQSTKEFFQGLGKSITKQVTPISTRLLNIDKRLVAKVKVEEGKKLERVKTHEKAALPFLQELVKLEEAEYYQLRAGLLNSQFDYKFAEEILDKYPKLRRGYNKLRKEVLEDIENTADKYGLVPQKIENYFPRVAKDPRAIYNELQKGEKSELGNKLQRQLEDQRKKVERAGGKMSEQDEIDFIARMIHAGQYNVLFDPRAAKERRLTHIPKSMLKHYASIEESIMSHIHDMNEAIFARRLTGKSDRQAKLHDLRKLGKKIENTKDVNTQAELLKEWETLNSTIDSVEEDTANSLNALIKELDIKPEQQQEAVDLLNARLNQRGMSGAMLAAKNVGLAMTIGNPLSAITQLGDQAQNIYKHKQDALGGMIKAINNGELTGRYSLDNVLREFGKEGKTSKTLDIILQRSGLKALDMFGKESFMQSARKKWSKASFDKFSEHFEAYEQFLDTKSLKKTHESLKNDEHISSDAAVLLLAELSNAQPISLSETSEGFLGAGNARIFWMLKQFALKQIDSINREVTTTWKKGGAKNKALALGKGISLVALLGLSGASTDEIKDLVLGRKTEEALSDRVMTNMMKLVFINRYALESSSGNQFLDDYVTGLMAPPPLRQVSTLATDIVKTITGGELVYNSMANTPIVGRLLFDRFTDMGKEADIKRTRRQITKDVEEALDKGVSARLRRNIVTFNKEARKYNLPTVKTSNLLKQAKARRLKKEKEKR